MNTLHQVSIDKDLPISLLNIELVNEIFTLNVHLRKLNESMESVNISYSQISSSYIQGSIDTETYINNMDMTSDRCKEIKTFLNKNLDEIKRLLAITSLLAKKDTLLGKLVSVSIEKDYPKWVKEALPYELQKLERDLETNREKSQDRITAVKNKQ